MQKGETMSSLKTDYKDDVFTGKRKYTEINNGDGTISFNDETEYTQTGDTYGATQINETNGVVNTLDSESYKSTDAAETSIADNDYFPFYDTSTTKQKKTLFSNLKNVLTNVFAIKTHSSSSTTYGTGNSSLYGHVKLSDNYTSSAGAADAAIGASSKAVFDSYTANKNSITTVSGTVTNLTTQVNTNKSNISNLTTRMTTVESNATTNATNISSLNTKMSTVENELTANSKRIYMDYKNGKYGINTSANRGADTFIPFKALPDLFSVTWARGSASESAPDWGAIYAGGCIIKDEVCVPWCSAGPYAANIPTNDFVSATVLSHSGDAPTTFTAKKALKYKRSSDTDYTNLAEGETFRSYATTLIFMDQD